MSLRTAEQQAERLFEKFGNGSVPIDVDEVAARLGVPVVYDDLGTEDVSGLLVSNEDGACIFIQKGDHPNRQRFSVAHEIAHFVLGHQKEAGEHVHVDRGHFISWRDPRSAAGVDPKEMEANRFAAVLLMPASLVKEKVSTMVLGPLLDQHVRKLAQEFEVSEQAMTIRLTKLGLL